MLEEGTKVVFQNLGKKIYGTVSKVDIKFPGIHSGKSTYEIRVKTESFTKVFFPATYSNEKKLKNV